MAIYLFLQSTVNLKKKKSRKTKQLKTKAEQFTNEDLQKEVVTVSQVELSIQQSQQPDRNGKDVYKKLNVY